MTYAATEARSERTSAGDSILPPEPRGGDVPFAPVVQPPPGAGPYAQLAAWLGRQP
jgi:hypothetical protein